MVLRYQVETLLYQEKPPKRFGLIIYPTWPPCSKIKQEKKREEKRILKKWMMFSPPAIQNLAIYW